MLSDVYWHLYPWRKRTDVKMRSEKAGLLVKHFIRNAKGTKSQKKTSSPGIKVAPHLQAHIHTHFPSKWTVSKQTGAHNTKVHSLHFKRKVCTYFSPNAFAQYSLSVSSTDWPILRSKAAFSQSVSRTNAPDRLPSGLCSSAMQQRTHKLTNTHTNCPLPLSLLSASHSDPVLSLPARPAHRGVLGERVRQKVHLREWVCLGVLKRGGVELRTQSAPVFP